MIKKKIIAGLVISLIIAVFTCSTFAYTLNPTIPTTKNLSFYTNGMTSTQKTAALNAAYTWTCVNNGISFGTLGDRTGRIDFDDYFSDVGFLDFNTIAWYYGVPATAQGYCYIDQVNNYNKFDIVLNTQCTWVNYNSNINNYYDMQGVFTHEFGHAAGLHHNNSIPGGGRPQDTSPVYYQTMYPYVNDYLGNNLTYYWRTLESDDISGVQYVYSLI